MDFSYTSVDAKHHGASLSERWNVTWVGNNSIIIHIKLQLSKSKCRHSLGLGERGPGNLSEQVEHVGVYNIAMFRHDILVLNGTLLKQWEL